MHKNMSGIFIILVSALSPVSFQLQQQPHGRLTHFTFRYVAMSVHIVSQ